MLPSPLDPSASRSPAVYVAPAAVPAPALRSVRPVPLVMLCLLMLACGAALALLVSQARPQAMTAMSTTQTVAALAAPAAAPANVAATVYASAGGAVVQILAGVGSGSGVVVDGQGSILTNNHVVQGARSVRVRFSDGTTRTGQVLATDANSDLALVKTDLPPGIPVARLGDASQVQVGETAIAIGSPFGLSQTVTQGIVSAINRAYPVGDGRTMRNLIQTDAPINPGNSGGPLFNARGEVIGITTLIESPVRGSVGVGFAVPISAAKQLLTAAGVTPVGAAKST